jgi:hypothetical protein
MMKISYRPAKRFETYMFGNFVLWNGLQNPLEYNKVILKTLTIKVLVNNKKKLYKYEMATKMHILTLLYVC